MVSLTAVVWLAIAAWVFVAIFAWAALRLAANFDRGRSPVVKVRRPRKPRAVDVGRRDDEAA